MKPHIASAGRKNCLLRDAPVAGFVLIVAYNNSLRRKASCLAGQAQRPARGLGAGGAGRRA